MRKWVGRSSKRGRHEDNQLITDLLQYREEKPSLYFVAFVTARIQRVWASRIKYFALFCGDYCLIVSPLFSGIVRQIF